MHLMLLAFFLAVSSFFHIDAIPPDAMKKMEGVTWHQGCPVPLTDLRRLKGKRGQTRF
jgi:hypothetical protein